MELLKITTLTYYAYFKGIIAFIFNKRGRYNCFMDSIVNQFSYRVPKIDSNFKLSFWVIKRCLEMIWKNVDNKIDFGNAESKIAVIDSSLAAKVAITQGYVKQLLNSDCNLFLVYGDLYFRGSLMKKLFLTVFMMSTLPFILIFSSYKPNRNYIIYSATELLDTIIMLSIFRQRKINNVVSFTSFERMTNLLCCVLNKYDIELIKVCSPNPISMFYKYVVANKFVFTAPFQKEQYELLKENWFVDEMLLWPVYDFKRYKDKYYGEPFQNENLNTIGFYSSGFAKRKELDNDTDDERYFESEKKLLQKLNAFLNKHIEYSLIIYLHPIEKQSESDYIQSSNYYENIFRNLDGRIQIYPRNINTWLDFQGINLSVSVTSTMSYERLYCGFKSLYITMCFNESIFKGTKLDSITLNDEKKFEDFLLCNLKLSNSDFVKKHQLEEYVYY